MDLERSIKPKSDWQHTGNGCYYTIIAVSSFKIGGTWLDEHLITYQSKDGDTYSRLEKDFRNSFENVLDIFGV